MLKYQHKSWRKWPKRRKPIMAEYHWLRCSCNSILILFSFIVSNNTDPKFRMQSGNQELATIYMRCKWLMKGHLQGSFILYSVCSAMTWALITLDFINQARLHCTAVPFIAGQSMHYFFWLHCIGTQGIEVPRVLVWAIAIGERKAGLLFAMPLTWRAPPHPLPLNSPNAVWLH